jgi:hypothetical protein
MYGVIPVADMFGYGQMLGQPQQQMMAQSQQPMPGQMGMSAPTVMNPGGGMQQPSDPLSYEQILSIETIRKTAQLLRQSGDEQAANIYEAAAVKLNKTKLGRQKRFDQAYQTVQGTMTQAMV